MVVGITGSSGSGKSEISKIFAENGFTVIDADELSRKVQGKGTPCADEITNHFGSGILLADGSIDRRALGEIVFKDTHKLKLLTDITHKYILKAMDDITGSSDGDILIDAPLLFEADVHKKCDVCIAVVADREIQIERICARDGISEEIAKARLDKQQSREFYISNCDYYIENNSNIDKIKTKALEIIALIRKGK